MDDLFTWRIKMVQQRFEVTLLCILYEDEANWLIKEAEKEELELVASKSGRMLMIEGAKDVYKVVSFLAKTGYAMEVALIREVVDYEPDITDPDEMEIEWIPE